MLKRPKILVVGSFVMDLIVSTTKMPESGQTVAGEAFSTAPGGKGANQAVQAALLGADVTMVGKVGKDGFGEQLLLAATMPALMCAMLLLITKCPLQSATLY